MPKTIGSRLGHHLASEVTTLSTCWKITRRDGVVQGLTDGVRDLKSDGVTYRTASGCTRNAIRSTLAAHPDSETRGSPSITVADSIAGDRGVLPKAKAESPSIYG